MGSIPHSATLKLISQADKADRISGFQVKAAFVIAIKCNINFK